MEFFGQRVVFASIHVIRSSRYLIQLALLALLLLLSACGGGASENTDEPGAALAANPLLGDPVDFYMFEDIALKASSKYQGETTEKGFASNESASTAITHSLFGAFGNVEDIKRYPDYHYHWLGMPWTALTTEIPLLDVNARRRDLPGWGTYKCVPGNPNAGEAVIKRKSQFIEDIGAVFWFTFDYKNCIHRSRNVRYNGSLQVVFVRERNETITSLLLAYDDVTLQKGGRTFNVTGAIKVLEPRACGLDGDRTHYLSIAEVNTGKSVFLENFTLGRYDRSDRSCDGYASDSNFFNGKLYDSEYGAVRVTTTEPLGDNINSHPKLQPYLIEEEENSKTAGEVLIASADDIISVGLTNHNFMAENPLSQLANNAAQVTLAGTNYPVPKTLQYNRELFHWGAFVDLADDDGDGMNNSWETLTELDNSNAADADSDMDEDARSAFIEFETGGDPVLSEIKGSLVDRRIDIDVSHVKYSYENISIRFRTLSDSYDPSFKDSKTILYFDAPGDWKIYNTSSCSVNSLNQLECLSMNSEIYVTFTPHTDGPVTLHSLTSEAANDIDMANNSQMFDIDFAKVQFDHTLTTSSESVAPSTGFHTLRAQVTKRFDNNSYEPTVEIAIPEGVTVDEVTAGLNGITSYRNCRGTDVIVCSVQNMNLGETLDIEISFSMQTDEDVEFGWAVVAFPYESVLENNVATTTVAKAQSARSILQPLVDAAPDGGSVLLPPGSYDGSINLRRKTLTISGSGNVNPTRLITFKNHDYSLNSFGDQSVIEDIEFVGPGSPIIYNSGDQLTISENRFFPSEVAGKVTDLLIRPIYSHWFLYSTRNASYRFINNEVNGFGTALGSECDQLLSATQFRASLIEGNIFSNINCKNGVIFGANVFDPRFTDVALTNFNNNTVSNVPLVFSFDYDPTSTFQHTSNIYNNIFHNADRLLNTSGASMLDSQLSTLNTLNNIVYGTGNPDYSQHVLLNDMTTIWADPLLVNPVARRYSLQPGSLAIDQSMVLPNNSWADSEAALFNYYPDRVVVKDGNNDGVGVEDIGAMEFAP